MSAIESYWDLVKDRAGSFPPEAFEFVRQGLAHTIDRVHGHHTLEVGSGLAADLAPADEELRHVSGQQLCMGLREFALQQYGLLARTVLEKWNVRRTDDFGKIVFAMIGAGLLRKTDRDSIEDFRSVYEFDEAFGSGGGPGGARQQSPRREA